MAHQGSRAIQSSCHSQRCFIDTCSAAAELTELSMALSATRYQRLRSPLDRRSLCGHVRFHFGRIGLRKIPHLDLRLRVFAAKKQTLLDGIGEVGQGTPYQYRERDCQWGAAKLSSEAMLSRNDRPCPANALSVRAQEEKLDSEGRGRDHHRTMTNRRQGQRSG